MWNALRLTLDGRDKMTAISALATPENASVFGSGVIDPEVVAAALGADKAAASIARKFLEARSVGGVVGHRLAIDDREGRAPTAAAFVVRFMSEMPFMLAATHDM